VKERPLAERMQNYAAVGECWMWLGTVASNGYGKIGIGGKSLSAHRVAYEQTNGPIPRGALVCHTCDNRRCINPAHLYAGSYQTNAADRQQRNRLPPAKGLLNGMSKLTPEQVTAIRASTKSYQTIADEYGVHKSTIGAIRKGTTWR
jgi:hypothetical protein